MKREQVQKPKTEHKEEEVTTDADVKRAREIRDNPKPEKKSRPVKEGLVRKEPQDLIDMIDETLLSWEEYRKTIETGSALGVR